MKNVAIDLTRAMLNNKTFHKRVLNMNEADVMRVCKMTLSEAKMLKNQAIILELKESN